MASVHRGARAVLRYFAPLYVLAIIVQVFLAGEGIFGIKSGPKLDDQKTLDAHRGLGFILADLGALLLLIVALLAWHPDRRIRTVSIALPRSVRLRAGQLAVQLGATVVRLPRPAEIDLVVSLRRGKDFLVVEVGPDLAEPAEIDVRERDARIVALHEHHLR